MRVGRRRSRSHSRSPRWRGRLRRRSTSSAHPATPLLRPVPRRSDHLRAAPETSWGPGWRSPRLQFPRGSSEAARPRGRHRAPVPGGLYRPCRRSRRTDRSGSRRSRRPCVDRRPAHRRRTARLADGLDDVRRRHAHRGAGRLRAADADRSVGAARRVAASTHRRGRRPVHRRRSDRGRDGRGQTSSTGRRDRAGPDRGEMRPSQPRRGVRGILGRAAPSRCWSGRST